MDLKLEQAAGILRRAHEKYSSDLLTFEVVELEEGEEPLLRIILRKDGNIRDIMEWRQPIITDDLSPDDLRYAAFAFGTARAAVELVENEDYDIFSDDLLNVDLLSLDELVSEDDFYEVARGGARKVAERLRVAYRAAWSVQPRSDESCKDFLEAVWAGDDYKAMIQANYEAFDRWGREAVELILNRYRNEPLKLAEILELPEGHTWRKWSELDPGEAVRRGFEGLGEPARIFVDLLAYHVRAIYMFERNGEYNLVYACDAEEGYGEQRKARLSLLVGGPRLDEGELDTVDERLPEYTRSCGWRVPDDLKRLYRVHHGLGRLSSFSTRFDNAGSIYPADQLAVVGKIMNQIAADQNFEPEGYRFDDLLTFFEDGAGNGQNFFRRGPDEQPIGTVDWDHETREVSSVSSFWEFLQGVPCQWWFGEEL